LVVLSSIGERGYVHRFAQAGFSAVLSKPAHQSHMLETLAHVVDAFNKGRRSGLVSIEGNLVSETAAEQHELAEGGEFSELVGQRILLVEDNRTNRAMAQEMLEDMGCVVATAENGEIGVEAVQEGSYDLILMDCQMPVMDGFESTGRIRHLEATGKLGNRTCIVALTANAMKGDKEKCLASGMDDYLAKPVRKRELQGMLEKWLLDKDVAETKEVKEEIKEGAKENPLLLPETVEKDGEETPFLDQEILSEARDMMKARFPDMVKFYLEDSASYLKAIRGGLDESDPQKIISSAHTIKSSSRQLGAILVSEIAKDIEAIAREIVNDDGGDMTVIAQKLEQLIRHFEQTEANLKKYLGTLNTG